MKTFSFLIKEARHEKGISQKELAGLLHIDSSLITRMEKGERLPVRAQVVQIAALLGLPEKKLLVRWLSEKIVKELQYEPLAREVLIAAEEQVRCRAVSAKAVSGELRKILKEIDQCKTRLDKVRHMGSAKFSEAYEVEYTYHSNLIEGNTLTLQETERVINHGITVSGKSMREHLEAINHYEAIALIQEFVSVKKPLTERFVLDIHALVLRGIDKENAGRYRDVQVRIGGSTHIPPNAMVVPQKMEELFEWYYKNQHMHPVLLSAEMHERLVSIHPFIDGNGRTSRLLMNLILLQHGYVIANLKGDKEHRFRYYDRLEDAQTDKKESFLKLIAETELSCIREYVSLLE
ncbi:MAG: helix-turn-helix domain-containing protein [Sphingomonadales bacterium]|nr:helix-turn-helix domain-containing protein [Sphingomonadales bacterium]